MSILVYNDGSSLLEVERHISSRFPRNSEANASEFLETLEEMLHRYLHGVKISVAVLNTQLHHSVPPVWKVLTKIKI